MSSPTMSDKIQRTGYASEATCFLRELETDADKNASPARQAEERKYARINRLRDEAGAEHGEEKIWSGF